MNDEPINVPEQPTVITEPPAPAPVAPPKASGSKKKLVIIGLVVAVLLVGGAAAYFMTAKDKTSETNNSAQGDTNDEAQAVKDTDIFYSASTYDKTVDFYDKTGAKIRSVSLNTTLAIPSTSVHVNDNIQVIAGGDRIFFMAGEYDENPYEVTLKTFELFELVDGTPQQLYKAGENESIVRWVVSADGTIIYMQTSSNDNNKDKGNDNRVLLTANKTILTLSDYVVDGSTWSSELFISPDSMELGYFFNSGGKLSKVSFNAADSKKTIKEYGLSCSGQELFCSPEYPDFISPDQKYLAWGYTKDDRFGVSIVELATSKVVSDFQLPTTDESIGRVHWSVDSAKIGFHIDTFSAEGQKRVGQLQRFLELSVGSNEPTQIFSDVSPGIDDSEGYRNAWVQVYGYAASGEYALISNENKLKVLKLSDKSVAGTVDGIQADSGKYVEWVR